MWRRGGCCSSRRCVSCACVRGLHDTTQVAAAIVGARNASHVQDYPAVFAFSLDKEDLGRIDEVLAAGKQPRGDCYAFERGTGPF